MGGVGHLDSEWAQLSSQLLHFTQLSSSLLLCGDQMINAHKMINALFPSENELAEEANGWY